MTINDLMDRLKQTDEVTLMELLELTSEDLVNRFQDKIEEQFESLETQFDDYTPWDNS
jgi:hypothetical protein